MSLDYRATSRRPAWSDLPDGVRSLISQAAGSDVVASQPCPGSGFSGAFATVLHLADGRSVFAKAGSDANPYLVSAHIREAHVLERLPDGVPAPALIGAASVAPGEVDERAWSVIVTQAVPGDMPLPFTPRALDAVHRACLRSTELLTPLPASFSDGAGEPPMTFAQDIAAVPEPMRAFADIADGHLPLTSGQPAWLPQRLGELDALAARASSVLVGETGCHLDLRADNILITPAAQAVFVDWNCVMAAPAWVDLACILGQAHGDGVDVSDLERTSPLLREVDPDDVDVFIAWLIGYYLTQADQPLFHGGIQAIRVHQRHSARTYLEWLAGRRSWTS